MILSNEKNYPFEYTGNFETSFYGHRELSWGNTQKALECRKEMLALPPVREIRKLENGDYQIAHYLFKVKEMELWGRNGRKKLHNTIFYQLLSYFLDTPDHYLSRERINKIFKNKSDEAIYKSISRFRALFKEDPDIKIINHLDGGYLFKIEL